MADAGGDFNAPILNLTPDEKRVYSQLFQQADTDRLGVVTGEVAVKFFEKTKLAPNVLGEIWQIADQENRGLLTKAGFCMAMRLIAHAQAGKDPTLDLAFKPSPLPRFDGINLQPSSPAVVNPPAPQLQAQVSGIRIPPLIPEKTAQYSGLFERSGAQNGILSGEMAKAIFERAGLPNEVLGRIWGLADREQKGALDINEFIIAMHLITSYKSRNMTAIPSALPPAFYEAASRRGQPAPRQVSVSTGSARLNPPPQRTASPLTRGPPGQPQPIAVQTTAQGWLVSPAEKAKYDQFFDTIDTSRSGYIDGGQAVAFFNDSGLSEDALASIWDLADIRSEGRLSRDEFAVAMYLIRQQRSGAPLPAFIPAALIPPSMRAQQPQQPQQAQAPVPAATPVPAAPKTAPPPSAADDLFGLDSPPAKPAAPQNVQTTGGSFARSPFDNDPFGDKAAAFTPQSTGPTQQSSMFKPFQPTSAFGASIATQNTGGSVNAPPPQNRGFQPGPSQLQARPADDDLLGDNDEEQSKKFTEETTELANMSTQVGNLRTQMQDVQAKKNTNEREVSAASSQKLELQQRLQQFRAQYEQEVAAVKSLEQQLNSLRTENSKMQQDLAMIEGSHQDLQTQHAQIAQALEADRTENANLKTRISQLNAEISQLKPQIDKMKSEARQHKGLVAVSKKQLATNETERDRLNGEMSDLKAEELERSRSAAASPASVMASPASTTHTNPFYRNITPSGIPDGVQSPTGFLATAPSPSAFDALFGPAAPRTGAQSAFPPPTTSFNAEPETGVRSMSPGPSTTMSPPQTRNLSPSRGEPPPPPESRQFTPRMLPVHTGGSFAGSTTSSTRVAPSAAGAIDGINTPRPEGPADFVRGFGAPPPAFPEGLLATSAIPASYLDRNNTGHSSVGTPLPEPIPGAFPSEESPEKAASPPAANFASPPAQPDFDSAFEHFGQPADRSVAHDEAFGQEEEAKKANEDFYPMTEPTDETDSSDDEDEAHHAAPFSAAHSTANGTTSKALETQEPIAESSAVPAAAPAPISLDTAALPPPPIEHQTSPPVYSPRENTQPDFPDEFHGLLPARSDPTVDSHLHSRPSVPEADREEPWTEVTAASRSFETAPAQTTNTSSVTFPEDDFADFNDLSEAKTHTADDRFDFTEDRSELEFNPNFDSPAASMTTAAMTASHQATPTAAGSSFHTFGTSSTADFGAFGQPSAAPSNHDWDAIFSGLDNGATTPKLASPSTAAAAPPAPVLERQQSTVSEHDDPILQRLVGMGYPRSKALDALEKYDYDISKAVDHLASST